MPTLNDNPGRPPKKWFSDCVAGVRAGARRTGRRVQDPSAVCGAQWQRLSAAQKRAAVRRHERRRRRRNAFFWENPIDSLG